MNRLTEEFHEFLRPEAALIAYCCEEPQRKYYLETRPILENGKMGEGRPVSHEFMNRLLSAYSESHSGTPFGFVPERLLYCDVRMGREKYVWFDPPGRRMMYFSEETIRCAYMRSGEKGRNRRRHCFSDRFSIPRPTMYASAHRVSTNLRIRTMRSFWHIGKNGSGSRSSPT